ncbi:MAG: SpoVT / AbrB like domain protein [Candidatus Bathyarchaeota archaeon BA1]|nr:MAG: SpoVT / AbrB like domain protein [Candidatus Bathyarchaeota archaeon BA1]
MSTSRLDSKGRVSIPREIREHLKIKRGALLRWIPLGERMIGLAVEVEEKCEYRDILSFLENLKAHKIERFGEPDYSPVSKSELWLKTSKE